MRDTGHVGVGDTWVDESRRVDEWMGMNMGNKGGHKERERETERAGGETWGNKREEQRQKCGCKILPCSSVGGLYGSSALSEESSGDKQGRGGKGGDEGT